MSDALHPADWATLDPSDWDVAATLAHRMMDDAFARLQGLRDGPVIRPRPDDVRPSFAASFQNQKVRSRGVSAFGAVRPRRFSRLLVGDKLDLRVW
jgi:hypothetical protein